MPRGTNKFSVAGVVLWFLPFACRAVSGVIPKGGIPLRCEDVDRLDEHRPRLLWKRLSKAVCGMPHVGVLWNGSHAGFDCLQPTFVEARNRLYQRRDHLTKSLGGTCAPVCGAMFTLA